MNLDQDHLKAMLFQTPDKIPVSIGILPAAFMRYRQELDAVLKHFPELVNVPENRDYEKVWSPTYHAGEWTDAWGCVWSNIHTGMHALVTGHPVPTRESIRELKQPTEDMGFPHGFMFLRLTDLRGFEEAMIDFAEDPPELQMLLDKVLQYNLRQGRLALEKMKEPQMVYFGDDLGMQAALPISPAKWRQYLKPSFRQIYAPFKARGHCVYMHTDGHIHEIIPDLVDCGVDVVNPQFRSNGLDNLVRVCKGKVCVDLDLDRQMMPFATPAELDAHIKGAIAALGSPKGGLWIKAEIGPDVPLENIEAILAALQRHRYMFSPAAAACA
jgi:hypothetical protein